jgi:predicted GNAT family N-acyltransferase
MSEYEWVDCLCGHMHQSKAKIWQRHIVEGRVRLGRRYMDRQYRGMKVGALLYRYAVQIREGLDPLDIP